MDGVRVGVNRPDLQYSMNGQRHHEEWDPPAPAAAPATVSLFWPDSLNYVRTVSVTYDGNRWRR